MTPAECQWLIRGSSSRLAPAKVYDRRRDGAHVVQDRSNTAAEFSLLETDLVLVLLRARISHTVGIPIHYGFKGVTKPGFITNTLTPFVGDGNTQTPEVKSFLVNVEKA